MCQSPHLISIGTQLATLLTFMFLNATWKKVETLTAANDTEELGNEFIDHFAPPLLFAFRMNIIPIAFFARNPKLRKWTWKRLRCNHNSVIVI